MPKKIAFFTPSKSASNRVFLVISCLGLSLLSACANVIPPCNAKISPPSSELRNTKWELVRWNLAPNARGEVRSRQIPQGDSSNPIQMIFDANWGELDFMLIDLPPGTGDIHLSIMQSLPITGAVVVSTPQAVALADAKKGVSMFMSDAIQVPVLGIIENMAYFTPEELPENKYYIFGKEGAKNLAADLDVPFLGEVPLVQSIREAGDYGRPAAMQTGTILETVFEELARSVVAETVKRNENLPATEAIKITTMAGCSAVKK